MFRNNAAVFFYVSPRTQLESLVNALPNEKKGLEEAKRFYITTQRAITENKNNDNVDTVLSTLFGKEKLPSMALPLLKLIADYAEVRSEIQQAAIISLQERAQKYRILHSDALTLATSLNLPFEQDPDLENAEKKPLLLTYPG